MRSSALGWLAELVVVSSQVACLAHEQALGELTEGAPGEAAIIGGHTRAGSVSHQHACAARSEPLRVALLAVQVRGSMGQYVDALAHALGTHVDLRVFVPEHYREPPGPFTVYRFVTGSRRSEALRSMLNPVSARRVWNEVNAFDPDIVHLFNGEGSPWGLLWARWARLQGVSFGISLHDPDGHPGDPLDRLQAILGRTILRNVSWVHIHTPQFVNKVVRRGVPRERTFVIPHGSLAPRFLRYRRPGVKQEQLALFFGRLVAYKGLDLLVDAGMLLNDGPRMVIAGPGQLPSRIIERLAAAPDRFELHNRFIQDAEVAHLFQRAAVCVMPYRHATQSSLPLIAAAFGVPVVATAVGGLTEDVPRVNGLIVRPNDSAALACGIRHAVELVPRYPIELEFEQLVYEFIRNYERHARPQRRATVDALAQP